MAKLTPKKHRRVGLAPGTLVHVGKKKIEKVRIRVIDYNESNLQELEIDQVEASFPFKETPTVTWLNIDGLHEVAVIEKIGKHFDLHPLLLEDILHTRQRPNSRTMANISLWCSKCFITKKMKTGWKWNRPASSQVPISSFLFQERVGDFLRRSGPP